MHIRNTPQQEFDCHWRHLAMDWAPKLQPWLNATQQRMLFDSLELATLCGKEFIPTATTANTRPPQPVNGLTIYVDPTSGSDSDPGTRAQPLASISAAVAASRRRTQVDDPATIILRKGTYYLNQTIELDARDSHLTITAYEDEEAIVSGGVLLAGLKWEQVAVGSDVHVASLAGRALPRGVPALHHRGQRATLARYPNANPELDTFPLGYVMDATIWLPPKYHGKVCDPNVLCGKSENHTIAVSDAWHGMFQNYTVGIGGACERYDPPYSPWCSGDFYLLRQFPEMHTRSPSGVRAAPHLPNAATYSARSHEGAVVHAWRPGHWYTWMFGVGKEIEPAHKVTQWAVHPNTNAVSSRVPVPKQNASGIVYLGEKESQDACFAACNATAGLCTSWTYHEPSFPSADWAKGCYILTDSSWQNVPQDHVVSARGPHSDGIGYTFDAGGHQGGEGNEAGGEWFIENIQEELDAPNEFYYDASEQRLFFWANQSATSTPDATVVVPTLATLFSLSGTQAQPVVGVTFEGLTFTASRPTFMEPRTNPSGGDWSLEREGAIKLEGTERCVMRRNYFTRLDTNAISINGYNRHTTVDVNEFVWLGQSAVTSWGRTEGNDGTSGNQPRYSVITNNFCHEIGHHQKQSSFYFQATTAQANVSNNIVFNIPRAALNYNDGFGGGSTVAHNLLFNTCRESGDHGAFNSWDRLPYLTTVATGTPSTVPALNNVHNNFIVANYAADGGCLDNDDGSAYYSIHHNFCVYGGHKQNFDGHSKHSSSNIYVYPQVYGVKCIDEEQEGMGTHTAGPDGLPKPGYAESYANNICILPAAGDPYYVGGGVLDHPKRFATGMALTNNTIYVPDGRASVTLSGVKVDFGQFQDRGFDLQSRVSGELPSHEQVIEWAKQLIGM